MKRGLSLLLVVSLILSLSFVFAQENNFVVDENTVGEDGSVSEVKEGSGEGASENIVEDEVLRGIVDENENVEETKPFLTPDSGFYFVEKIFAQFRSDVANLRVKIAEVRELVRERKFEKAKISLESLREYANKIENNADPEVREEARQAIAEIIKTIDNLRAEIPEEYQKEFVDEVLDSSRRIATAIEISNQIKDLCSKLSKIDPLEYDKVCNAGDNSKPWLKELNKDLTEEQKREAEEFGRIIGECFRTSGQQCRCEDITFVAMSEMCITTRPLAVACDVEENEEACDKLDSLEFPELPDYLEDIMMNLEERYDEDSYENHIPRKCREAGITGEDRRDREECFKIMVKENAPEECRNELLSRNIQNEREARKICEEIMFKLNAPEECVEAGITNGEECGEYMFKQDAPQECIDAGLTGKNRNDHRKCEEIMRSLERRDFNGEGEFDRRGSPGGDCMRISDEKERLKCFEQAVSGFGDFENRHREKSKDMYGKDFEIRFRETQERQNKCELSCRNQGRPWDFSNGVCSCGPSQNGKDNERGFCGDGICGMNCPSDPRMGAPCLSENQNSCPMDCRSGTEKSVGCAEEKKPFCDQGGYAYCNTQKQYWECSYTGYDKGSGDVCGGLSRSSSPISCPTGELKCINNAWGCSDGNSKSTGSSCNNNGKCESGESSTNCPSDCGGYVGGSCYGKSQSQCINSCVWYSDSTHLTSRSESSHCDDVAHGQTSGNVVTNFEGDCTKNGGTWLSNEYRCDYSKSTYTGGCSGSPPCSGGYCQNGAWVCPSTGSTSCSSSEYWDGSKCVASSQGTTTTTTSSGSSGGGADCSSQSYPSWPDCETIECVSGNYQCTKMKSSSGTTGAAITGKSIYDNSFLRYYFGK